MCACSICSASRPSIWKGRSKTSISWAPKDWTTAVFLMFSRETYEHLIPRQRSKRSALRDVYSACRVLVPIVFGSLLDRRAIVVDITRKEPTGLAKIIIDANKMIEEKKSKPGK